jgi:HAD superfamily hydrolase (TIGR01549 family)
MLMEKDFQAPWRNLQAKISSPRQSFPKVRDLFQRLLADGKRIGLASSAVGEELETYKKAAGIADLVDAETSADDADRSKPHAEIFVAALERLGNPGSESTLVVGDTPYDIQAAKKVRLGTIALRCGGFPEESLAGAIVIYDDPRSLRPLPLCTALTLPNKRNTSRSCGEQPPRPREPLAVLPCQRPDARLSLMKGRSERRTA